MGALTPSEIERLIKGPQIPPGSKLAKSKTESVSTSVQQVVVTPEVFEINGKKYMARTSLVVKYENLIEIFEVPDGTS